LAAGTIIVLLALDRLLGGKARRLLNKLAKEKDLIYLPPDPYNVWSVKVFPRVLGKYRGYKILVIDSGHPLFTKNKVEIDHGLPLTDTQIMWIVAQGYLDRLKRETQSSKARITKTKLTLRCGPLENVDHICWLLDLLIITRDAIWADMEKIGPDKVGQIDG